jgi:hypothetical protein
MSLMLRPNPDGAPDDHHVMQGEWQVGRIHRRQDARRPDVQWFWIISWVFRGPDGLRLSGMNATLDESFAALKEAWNKWLAWAGLTQAKAEAGTGPRVLSVTIKRAPASDT